MSLRIIETYSEGDYTDYEVWECSRCKRQHTTLAGADPACCPCEFDEP